MHFNFWFLYFLFIFAGLIKLFYTFFFWWWFLFKNFPTHFHAMSNYLFCTHH